MLLAKYYIECGAGHADEVVQNVSHLQAETVEGQTCDHVGEHLANSCDDDVGEDVSLEILHLEEYVVVAVNAGDPLHSKNDKIHPMRSITQ